MKIKVKDQQKRRCYPNAQLQYYFSTKSCKQFNYYKDTSISELLNNIGELGLSILILDDGNFNDNVTKISASNKIYSDDDYNNFITILYNKFNIKCSLYRHPNNNTKNYFRIPSSEYMSIADIIKNNVKCDYVNTKIKDRIA